MANHFPYSDAAKWAALQENLRQGVPAVGETNWEAVAEWFQLPVINKQNKLEWIDTGYLDVFYVLLKGLRCHRLDPMIFSRVR